MKKNWFVLVWILKDKKNPVWFGWFGLVWFESNFGLDLVWKFQNRIYFGLVWF